MSNIIVSIDFMSGTTVKEAVTEAKEKCLEWDVSFVKFTFNNVEFYISRNAVVYEIVEKFFDRSNNICIICG